MCNQQNIFILKYSSGSAFYVELFCSQKGMQKLNNHFLSDAHTVQKSVDKHHRSFVEQVSNQDMKLIVKISQIIFSNLTLLHYIIQWEQGPAFSHISCNHQNIFVLKYSIGRDFYVNSILLSRRRNKNLNNSLLLDTHTFQKSVDKHHRSLEERVSN